MTISKSRAATFRIDAVEKLPSGFLRVSGNLTKTGVFNYAFGEGMVRELRSDTDVFADASLDTLIGAPVTVDHPAAMVGLKNASHLSVGTVIKVKKSTPYVEGTMQITDAKTIAMVEAGNLVEVSLGYSMTPVEHDDTLVADYRQSDIVYNHAALGPSGWGRLGSDVSLRLDADMNLDLSSFRMDREGVELDPIFEAYRKAAEAFARLRK